MSKPMPKVAIHLLVDDPLDGHVARCGQSRVVFMCADIRRVTCGRCLALEKPETRRFYTSDSVARAGRRETR